MTMNEVVAPMYKLKPVLEPNSVFNYNSSMYRMKNVVNPTSSQTGPVDKSDDDIYSDVERSQAIIFEYIRAIKKQIEELRRILLERSGNGAPVNKSSVDEMSDGFNKSGVTHEVVINCDIDCPPYSLLALHHLTKNLITLRISQHRHSSVKVLPDVSDKFDAFNGSSVDGRSALNVRLIWKNGGGTSVVLGLVPLTGEVSLLRFVNACLKQKRSPSVEVKLQQLLDQLNNAGCSSFESIVDGTQHLLDNKLTVVDIALWSALKRTKPSGKLLLWFQHFDKILSN